MFVKLKLTSKAPKNFQKSLLADFAKTVAYGSIPLSELNTGTIEKAGKTSKNKEDLQRLLKMSYDESTYDDRKLLIDIIHRAWESMCAKNKVYTYGYGQGVFEESLSVSPVKMITEATLKGSVVVIIPEANTQKYIC